MATEGPKIKVKNPVVELDGDEVRIFFSPLSQCYPVATTVSVDVAMYTFIYPSIGSTARFRHAKRGETRRVLSSEAQRTCAHASSAHVANHTRSSVALDDSHYLEGDQRKSKYRGPAGSLPPPSCVMRCRPVPSLRN